MPRPVDLSKIRASTVASLQVATRRYQALVAEGANYLLLRWVAQMTAVEVHASWERFAECRLVAALSHRPSHFLKANQVRGVARIPKGLALYLARGGRRYFDFKSMGDLLGQADRLLSNSQNPFRTISAADQGYLDALASIRNCVVHRSDAAVASYKRELRRIYGVRSAPEPPEFLHAKDYRAASPLRYEHRVLGLATVVERCARNT